MQKSLSLLPRIFIAIATALGGALSTVAAGPVSNGHVEAELVTDVAAIVPGSTFTVALRLKHDPHWHSYWVNPGDAGLATEISWKLPDGFSAGPIQWPAPGITDTGGLKTYGYDDQIFLLVDVSAPASLKTGSDITLDANATWLMCQDVCMPGEAELSLTLPVATKAGSNGKWSAALAKARSEIPSVSPALSAKGYRQGKEITLVVDASRDINPAAHGFYYFDDKGLIEAGADQTVTRTGREVRIQLKQSEYAENPARLSGLIRAEGGWFDEGVATHAIAFDVVDTAPPVATAGTTASTGTPGTRGGLAQVLVLAFLGGLILNLMPCVFPVIGIKIMGFVNQAGEERGRPTRLGFPAPIAGVCLCADGAPARLRPEHERCVRNRRIVDWRRIAAAGEKRTRRNLLLGRACDGRSHALRSADARTRADRGALAAAVRVGAHVFRHRARTLDTIPAALRVPRSDPFAAQAWGLDGDIQTSDGLPALRNGSLPRVGARCAGGRRTIPKSPARTRRGGSRLLGARPLGRASPFTRRAARGIHGGGAHCDRRIRLRYAAQRVRRGRPRASRNFGRKDSPSTSISPPDGA